MEEAYKCLLKNSYTKLETSKNLKDKTKHYHLKLVYETRKKLFRAVIIFFKTKDKNKMNEQYDFFLKMKRLHKTQLKKIGDILNYKTHKKLYYIMTELMAYRLLTT